MDDYDFENSIVVDIVEKLSEYYVPPIIAWPVALVLTLFVAILAFIFLLVVPEKLIDKINRKWEKRNDNISKDSSTGRQKVRSNRNISTNGRRKTGANKNRSRTK